jgi:hypothetical protein
MQTATLAGYNLSQLNQSQLQKANGGSTQSQDTTFDTSANCAITPSFPSAPNACANVAQFADTGTNQNHLIQSINQDENSAATAAIQRQGRFDGGLKGRVHQETTPGGVGSSQNTASQSKSQHESAPAGAFQTQFDPASCCGFASQLGGTGNTENIDQSSALAATEPAADQQSEMQGTSHSPDGSCVISQHAKINIDMANNSDTESPCPFLTLSTFCTSGGELQVQQEEGPGCVALPPDLSPPICELACLDAGPLLAIVPRSG